MSGPKRSPGDPQAQLFDTAVRLHGEGQVQRAEYVYREVLRQNPRHADALNMLGVLGCQSGNPVAGADLLRRALALVPDHPDYHNNLGMALLQTGDPGAAQAQFERAVSVRPKFAEAWFNLGNVSLAMGRHEDAEKQWRKALRVRADYPDVLNNLGNLLRQRGAPREAAQLFQRLVRLQPTFAPGQHNLGLALLAAGAVDDALAAFARACELDRGLVGAWLRRGDCHRRRGEPAAAEAAYREALDSGGPRADTLDALGGVLLLQGHVEAARDAFAQAAELAPGDATIADHLGAAWAALGERDRARACFERAVAHDPACGSAWRNLAELAGASDAEALLARLDDALAATAADAAGRATMEFARGHLLDLVGRRELAFAAWSAANASRRRVVRFDAAAQARFIDALIETFDVDFFGALAAGRDAAAPRPVLVIGMPRSGTSLVEQVLAAHPEVHGAGELTFFPEQAGALPRRWQARQPFPRCVAGRAGEVAGLGAAYRDLLRARGGTASCVVDKMPYNFLYLGLVAAAAPGARVIHCRRDPRATCFSLFTRELAGEHPYTYDLEDLAAAYAGYRRLMAHWRRCLPLAMFELDYEDLVTDLEGQARGLLDFIGLPWSPACLDFHRQSRAVTTASQWQVRRPVYTTSREHWRDYEQQLEPLLAALARHGVSATSAAGS